MPPSYAPMLDAAAGSASVLQPPAPRAAAKQATGSPLAGAQIASVGEERSSLSSTRASVPSWFHLSSERHRTCRFSGAIFSPLSSAKHLLRCDRCFAARRCHPDRRNGSGGHGLRYGGSFHHVRAKCFWRGSHHDCPKRLQVRQQPVRSRRHWRLVRAHVDGVQQER